MRENNTESISVSGVTTNSACKAVFSQCGDGRRDPYSFPPKQRTVLC